MDKPTPSDANWLKAFDIAVADELRHVSSVPYNSREICQWFSERVRQRLAATDAPKGEPTAEALTQRAELMRLIDAYAFDYQYTGKLAVTRAQVEKAILALVQPSPTMADAKDAINACNGCKTPAICREHNYTLCNVPMADAIAAGEPTYEQLCEWQANHETWWSAINGDAHFNLTTKNQSNAAYKQGRADALRASAGTPHGAREPAQLPESMSRDEMLKYYSEYANMQSNEALRYQKRIRDLEAALKAREPADAKDAALSVARAALLEMATACGGCQDGPDPEYCCRQVQWDAIKAIDGIGQSAKEKQS